MHRASRNSRFDFDGLRGMLGVPGPRQTGPQLKTTLSGQEMGEAMTRPIRMLRWALVLAAYVSTIVGGDCLRGQGPVLIKGRLTADIVCGTQPSIIEKTKACPVYPAKARDQWVEGHATLQVVVDKKGHVREPKILAESPKGFGIADAATAAVEQWRYVPAKVGGEAVESYLTIRVGFELD